MRFEVFSWMPVLISSMMILRTESTSGEVFDSSATIELILFNDENVKTIKYMRGVYTTAGAVFNVEGNIEQIHPNILCIGNPKLTFGKIYIVKLEPKSLYSQRTSFCESAVEKASMAITHGASAVILITTERLEDSISELSKIVQPLDRPVIMVNEVSEEDKLFAILHQRKSAYMRVAPVKAPVTEAVIPEDNSKLNHYSQENITYIGIAVIFGLIVVLVAVAVGAIIKLRSIRHRIQSQTRGRLLQSIGTHKYRQNNVAAAASLEGLPPGSCLDSTGPCPICLENYKVGEEVRLLPCTHQYHRKCIDKWLMEHSTCPCCCEDVDALVRLGTENLRGYRNTKGTSSTPSHSQCATELLLNTSMTHKHSSHSRCISYRPANIPLENSDMRELHPPSKQEVYGQEQYQYLLQKLYEVKLQRPSSTSDTDASNRLSLLSSCYGSAFDINSSIPSENLFIGDSCQGGIPHRCDSLSLCDTDIDIRPSIKPYTSSKSTLPSVESASMSPRVSEFDLSENSSLLKLPRSEDQSFQCDHCLHLHEDRQCKRSRRAKSRTVRFREPESEVMSSADDGPHSYTPCQVCQRLKDSITISNDTSVMWSDEDSSSSHNVVMEKNEGPETEGSV